MTNDSVLNIRIPSSLAETSRRAPEEYARPDLSFRASRYRERVGKEGREMNHDWKAIARARWPHIGNIHGDGRYAIQVIGPVTGRTRCVVLCSDEATQKSASLFYDKVLHVDLLEKAPKCMTRPDDAEDRRWSREFERKNA